MSTFKKCDDVDEKVRKLVNQVLAKHESHKPVLDAKVAIDLGFAYADIDEAGNPTGSAIMHKGHTVLGVVRKISLKDRALGRGDAEIILDGDWWKEAAEKDKEGLLDHELHHIEVKKDEDDKVLSDDLGRPLLKLRNHDVEFGWFRIVAARNGTHSPERITAQALMDESGQYFWPDTLRLVPEKEKAKAAA